MVDFSGLILKDVLRRKLDVYMDSVNQIGVRIAKHYYVATDEDMKELDELKTKFLEDVITTVKESKSSDTSQNTTI